MPWKSSQSSCAPHVRSGLHWLVSPVAVHTSRLVDVTQRLAPGAHGPQWPAPKHVSAHAGDPTRRKRCTRAASGPGRGSRPPPPGIRRTWACAGRTCWARTPPPAVTARRCRTLELRSRAPLIRRRRACAALAVAEAYRIGIGARRVRRPHPADALLAVARGRRGAAHRALGAHERVDRRVGRRRHVDGGVRIERHRRVDADAVAALVAPALVPRRAHAVAREVAVLVVEPGAESAGRAHDDHHPHPAPPLACAWEHDPSFSPRGRGVRRQLASPTATSDMPMGSGMRSSTRRSGVSLSYRATCLTGRSFRRSTRELRNQPGMPRRFM